MRAIGAKLDDALPLQPVKDGFDAVPGNREQHGQNPNRQAIVHQERVHDENLIFIRVTKKNRILRISQPVDLFTFFITILLRQHAKLLSPVLPGSADVSPAMRSQLLQLRTHIVLV